MYFIVKKTGKNTYIPSAISFIFTDVLHLFQVRCWEIQDNGQTIPKAQQMHTGPVLDVCWSDVRSIISEEMYLKGL